MLESALHSRPQLVAFLAHQPSLRPGGRELIPETLDLPLKVAESGIGTPDDVATVARLGAHAVLVGESLMRQTDVEAATRTLMGG